MEKGVPTYLVTVLLFALACSLASAFDPSPLQDFCVASKDSNDTLLSAKFVNGKFCNDPKHATANDFFFSGLDKAGDTSNRQGSNITATAKVINKGDVFVFPVGLIHFQWNMGNTNALVFASLSSQNPRLITIADVVFGADPPINPNVLAKAFQVDKNVINYLEQQFK
ncbi:Germin-like protein subfamily 1 member 16 [Morella rubra]|uniref:Germin-like protein n=1 Tax=Morella rubra TaxID=262757 RepID=A0A6A1WQ12_9ROSI|nr:Germin-like protein subfamily 1 member 16 [Morella rubra]